MILKRIPFLCFTVLLVLLSTLNVNAINTNIDNLISADDWEALFPNRAGKAGNHPQGITDDFYSYANLRQAIDEMSDYLVETTTKEGIYGYYITVTRKSTGASYVYQEVSAFWDQSTASETVTVIDFEQFLNTFDQSNNKRELAAFLANISKETTGGWEYPVGGGSNGDYAKWGLYFVHELNCTNASCKYNLASTEFPANPAYGYFGRGPIQLSYNVNYGQFSKFIYNDKNILLNNPDALIQDGVLALKSAIWFWMMPQCPKPSCHQVMHDLWLPEVGYSPKMYLKGFAQTNNIINGGLECRTTSEPGFTEKVVMRSELYKYYLGIMGLSQSEIDQEDEGDYSTLCYKSNTEAMDVYDNCESLSLITSSKKVVLKTAEVFPNPASNQLTIKNTQLMNSIQIVSLSGKVVKTINANEKSIVIDVSGLAAGYFTLVVQSVNGVENSSMVIK